MTKNFLLTAVAATALIAAGSAQAGSLSARAGGNGVLAVGAPGGSIAVTAASPYKLASELNFLTGVSSAAGQFDTVFTFNTALTPGSYTVTLAYSGATITAAVPTTAVTSTVTQAGGVDTTAQTGFEASTIDTDGAGPIVSSGPNILTVVGQTANSVTFQLQVSNGNSVGGIFLAPALNVTGPVSVTAAVTNQVTGAVVDPAVIQPLITTGNRSIAAAIRRNLTGDGTAASLDTRVGEGAGGFNTLTGDAPVGDVVIAVAGTPAYDAIVTPAATSTTVYKNLNGTAVTLADVTSASVNTTGQIAGLNFNINGGTAVTAAANSATVAATAGQIATGVLTFNAAPTSTTLATAPQLSPTELSASLSYGLAAGFAAQPAVVGSFETLQSDGFTYIVPWVASQTLGGANGSQSVIRVSNINGDASTAGGRVYAQMYNSSTNATPVGRTALLGTIGNLATGNNELVITSQTLENAFGNFGRADFRLIVTDPAVAVNTVPGAATGAAPAPINTGVNSIVVKRLIATSNGGLTEVEVLAGAIGSEANIPGNQAAPY